MRRTDQWHDIESAFPESDIMDARIIVTTTIHPVANACSSSNRYVYKLTPLDEDNSGQLFLGRFPSERRSTLKESAAEILKKCDGLPLALVSLSEYLLSGTTCEDACRKLGAYLAEEGGELRRMRRVLVNKYTSLSGHDLKACLLYFCMFPCDHPTRRNSLIRRWLAEGFVGAKPGCSPQDVAVEKLKDLIDRNIIQSMEVSTNGNVKRCRPHGMMLEYICYKSMAENFATLVPPAQRIRRLFLHQTNSAADHNWISGIDLSRVRTLAVSGNACKAILEFDKYTLLGVLDLKESSAVLNGKQVQDICKLMLLKYLSLGNTVVRLPRDIGKLEQLETLEMKTTEPVEVYSEVIELPKLKHLIGKFKLLDKPDRKLEKFLSESSILEMVTGFVIGKSKGFAQLMSHMGLLRQVKIWCDSMANESNLNDISKAIKKFIRHGTAMASDNRSLSIDFAECSPDFSKLVLESLQDIGGSLAALKLRGELRQFMSSHDFVTKMNGVQELCLSSTKLSGVDIIKALSNLGALKYLKLVEDNLGSFTIQPDKFKSLERLCFVCVPRLDITIQAGALPLLVSLRILCEALAGVLPPGIVIGRLESLKEIALLDSGLTPAVKHGWKIAAKGHANRPDVLFIQN